MPYRAEVEIRPRADLSPLGRILVLFVATDTPQGVDEPPLQPKSLVTQGLRVLAEQGF